MPRGAAPLTRLACKDDWLFQYHNSSIPPSDNDRKLSKNAAFDHLPCAIAHVSFSYLSTEGVLRAPLLNRKSPIAIALEKH